MGQYYVIVNVDKRLQFLPFDYDNGLKLMEWAYDRNPMVLALMNLMAEDWKHDRVYVIGDYADLSNPNETWYDEYVALLTEFGTDSMYNWAKEHCKRVMPDRLLRTYPLYHEEEFAAHADVVGCTEDRGYRYIYNHATRQVIDMKKCPIEWTWDSGELKGVTKIAPLPLLLTMGNDRGGGDFHAGHSGYEHVGTWCSTVRDIEITQTPLESAANYEEFRPNFSENSVLKWEGETE